MNGSVRMGRVLGVPLRIHWTVPLLVMLFGYSLGSRTLPATVPEQSNGVYTVAGLAGALLLLGSLLAHEAAHAITARRKGIEVQSITLWALGGMTEMGRPGAARAVFLVAVSGPQPGRRCGGVRRGHRAGRGIRLGGTRGRPGVARMGERRPGRVQPAAGRAARRRAGGAGTGVVAYGRPRPG
ncbi:hypothetical protein ACWD26_31680 [Streptomyces sp. NPDC002787]